MSLVFRRVKKISKRARKSRSRTRKSYMDTSEYKPSLLAADDENFPSLNAVYKTDIFGTPIDFHIRKGWDMCGLHKHKVSLNSITFMKEYCGKSFDELRWEDYQGNRKNSHYFEERSYLKCLSGKNNTRKCGFELIQPTKNFGYIEPGPKREPYISDNDVRSTKGKWPPKIPSADYSKTRRAPSETSINLGVVEPDKNVTYEHFPLSKTDSFLKLKRASKSALPIIDEEISEASKEAKPRSILTNAGKLPQVVAKEERRTEHHSEATGGAIRGCTRPPPLSSRQESIEIMRTKLISFFENAELTATMPYDFVPQNQKFYMPCADISFVYQNARPSPSAARKRESVFDLLRDNPKVEPHFDKCCLCAKPLGGRFSKKFDFCREYSVNKYTPENKFNAEYFWRKVDPYSWGASSSSKAKYFISGRNIVE